MTETALQKRGQILAWLCRLTGQEGGLTMLPAERSEQDQLPDGWAPDPEDLERSSRARLLGEVSPATLADVLRRQRSAVQKVILEGLSPQVRERLRREGGWKGTEVSESRAVSRLVEVWIWRAFERRIWSRRQNQERQP